MNPALELAAVRVVFGGIIAVDQVDLRAPGGVITGLIGPNGAGKTTTFNAATGSVATASGSVRLGNRVLDAMSATARAQAGLGRTFQKMELFDSLTVQENVALGPELSFAGKALWRHLVGTRRERLEALRLAETAIARCGIGDLAQRTTAELATGQRRLVELARAIATPFQFLLLDEPSSGLDSAETARFGSILLDVVAERGTGILLVEHDMALVRAICSYVYVLDFGKLIFEGATDHALGSEIVRAAYLGSEDLEALAG